MMDINDPRRRTAVHRFSMGVFVVTLALLLGACEGSGSFGADQTAGSTWDDMTWDSGRWD